jgi:hypothetical protein
MNSFERLAARLVLGASLVGAGGAGAQNLVVNGELDTDLTGWTATPNVDWLEEDHDACSGSGGALLGPNPEAGEGIHQAIPWSANQPRFWARFRYRAQPPPPPFGDLRSAAPPIAAGTQSGLVSPRIASHAAPDCSGNATFTVIFPLPVEGYFDWTEISLTSPTSFPAGTQCVRLTLSWTWQGGPVTEDEVDGLELATGFPIHFGDFEFDADPSTCRWSATAGLLGEE